MVIVRSSLLASTERVCSNFSGRIGLAAINLETGDELTVDAEPLFPIASVLKVPVLLEVLLQAADGAFSLNDPLEPNIDHRTFGSGVLKELSDSVRMTVRDVAI